MARLVTIMVADAAPTIQTAGSGSEMEFVVGEDVGKGACEGCWVCWGRGVGDVCEVDVGCGEGDCWGTGEG